MVGRKPTQPPSIVCDAVLKFKDKIIRINDYGEKGKIHIIIF